MRKKQKRINKLIIYGILSLTFYSCNGGERTYAFLDLDHKKVKVTSDLSIESITIQSTGPDTILYIEPSVKSSSIYFLNYSNTKKYIFKKEKYMDTVLKDYFVYINCKDSDNHPVFFIKDYSTKNLLKINDTIRNQGYL